MPATSTTAQHDLAPPAEYAFKRRLTAGFTLVEIAIVLVIIGLIVGGILVGGVMIRNAEIQKTLRQKDSIMAGIAAFRLKYGYNPGDFMTATNEWGTATTCPNPCCSDSIVTTGVATCNGNGDGLIAYTSGGGDPQYYQQLSEDGLAWQHLSNASLIPGKYDGGTAEKAVGGAFSPRVSRPDSAIATNSGWSFYYIGVQSGGSRFFDGNYGTALVLTRDFPWVSSGPDLLGVMTPIEQANLDAKIDDGSPITGLLRSGPIGGWGGHCTTANDATAVYYPSSSSWAKSPSVCAPIFLLNL